MKPREQGTPFRTSQARDVIEGIVRWLAPKMQRFDGLREAVRSIADDHELWAELELAREDLPGPGSTPTVPNRPAAWEHCSTIHAARELTCAKCGAVRP